MVISNILQSLPKTILSSIITTLIFFGFLFYLNDGWSNDRYFWSAIFRYLHVVSGIMWIGLLWYFNFVQIPSMPKIPDEQKSAISKVIAPAALFWFRWAALSTIVTGLITAYLNGYVHEALAFKGGAKNLTIGIGMWLGIIMAFNVWFVIWPNQKRALGIAECDTEIRTKSARTAMLISRINTILSIPMLLTMVIAQNLY
ncbi:MAG: urate hydroxylase PuuD [Pelagibacterales bacterium]|nr:urate hydroxylase PuuD [Pelagibacterales bacterium]